MGSFEGTVDGEETADEYFEQEREKLDEAFKGNIADMKPFVLSLPEKEERQRIAQWIKKLCTFPGPKLRDRKNRNLYGKLLLFMLRKGTIDEPFLDNPTVGKLPTIPAYMAMQLEESLSNQRKQESKFTGPDWIREELPSSDSLFGKGGNHNGRVNEVSLQKTSHQRNYRERRSPKHLKMDDYSYFDSIVDQEATSESDPHLLGVPDDTFEEDKIRSLHLPPNSPVRGKLPLSQRQDELKSQGRIRRLQKKPEMKMAVVARDPLAYSSDLLREEKENLRQQDKELELRQKMLEAKFEEERLTLQQRHDMAVRKILDRKNSEVEEIRTYYKQKVGTLEDVNKKLEKQASHLKREVGVIKERSSQEIEELKQTIQQNLLIARHEKEKEVHDTVAAFEQEKYEMQKQLATVSHEQRQDYEDRIKELETDISSRSSALTNTIQKLEERNQQLSKECDSSRKEIIKLSEEKAEFQDKFSQLTQEGDRLKKMTEKLEVENRKLLDDHDNRVRTLRKKTEKAIDDMKKEHSLATTQATDMIAELEGKISYYKQAVEESEYQRKKEMRELDTNHKQELLRIEVLYDKKVRTLQREKDDFESEKHSAIQKLEVALSGKDEKLHQLNVELKGRADQAETAINEFKEQAEEKSRKMFQEMTEQTEKLESELSRAKQVKEIQVNDLKKQLDSQKTQKENEIAELKTTFEDERNILHRTYQTERESIIQDHQRDREMLVNKYEEKIFDRDEKMRLLQEEKTKVVTQLETQVRELREEVIQANNLRKQQLVELGMLRDEEKQTAKRQEETLQIKFKSQIEQQRLQLQKEHKVEVEQLLEKTNTKLKDIEREYEGRIQKCEETIANLQQQVTQMQEKECKMRSSYEGKLSDIAIKHSQEKDEMKQHHKSVSQSLNQDIELFKIKSKQLERKYQQLELEKQEKISTLRLHYEEKMKSLLPSSVQKELESTINSLKEQVSMLQARVQILQEGLDVSMSSSVRETGDPTSP